MDTPSFSSLGIAPMFLETVAELGFERPSPIQALAIPAALEGGDLVGLSETGSGKTAAFGLPILQKIEVENRTPQALVICPTRELAVQVCEQIHLLGSGFGKGLIVAPVYGGASMERQIGLLKRGAQIVVGTPGRLLDLHRRRALKLDQIRVTVLDEADRMLDMGFREEMEELLGKMPAERQALFFSATMNKQVERLIQNFGNEPEVLEIQQKTLTVDSIDQAVFEVRQRSKIEVLSRLLDMEPPQRAIVFCNTKRSVDDCTEALIARGYGADRLHGDITQAMRERVLRRFREGTVELLVATDVAARGLDVDDVEAVFNYDLPHDPEDYVHRIGRTGRAGKSGRAISFVFGRDIYKLQMIERYIRKKIRRERIPTQEQVEGRIADQLFEAVRETLENGNYESHKEDVDRLLNVGHSATDIASAVLSLLHEGHGRDGEEIVEDRPDKPRNERKPKREKRERADEAKRDHGPAPKENDKGMVTLFLSIGQKAKVRAGDVAGMIYREAELPKGVLGRIKLGPKFTLVDVQGEYAEQVLDRCQRSKLRGKTFRIGYDERG